MSGRVRHTLPDGRRVIGFRKTFAERGPRTPKHLMPDWVLRFTPPPVMALCLRPGPTGVIGARFTEAGTIEVTGKDRAWVIEQAQKLCTHAVGPIEAVLERASHPGPTVSAPARPAVRQIVELRAA